MKLAKLMFAVAMLLALSATAQARGFYSSGDSVEIYIGGDGGCFYFGSGSSGYYPSYGYSYRPQGGGYSYYDYDYDYGSWPGSQYRRPYPSQGYFPYGYGPNDCQWGGCGGRYYPGHRHRHRWHDHGRRDGDNWRYRR